MRRLLTVVGTLMCCSCLLIDDLAGTYDVGPDAVDLTASCEEQPEQQCSAIWSNTFTNTATIEIGGMAVSSESVLYVVGAYAGELSFGFETLAATDTDSFIAAFDNDGNFQHGATTGGVGNERAAAVAVDGLDVVMAGTYSSAFDQCGGDDPGDGGIFVRFANAGSLTTQLTRCMAVSGTFDVSGVVLSGGSARVVGSFSGALVDDTMTIESVETDGFVWTVSDALYDVTIVTGAGEQTIDTAVLLPGGFGVAGTFEEAIVIDEASSEAVEGADAYLAMIADDGSAVAIHAWGGEDDQQIGAIVWRDGTLYLAGEIDGGAVDFGDGLEVVAPDGDRVGGFVAAFELDGLALGAPRWVTPLTADDMDVEAVAVSGGPRGAVYVGGTVDAALFAGDGAPTPGACVDVFVVRLERDTGRYESISRCGDQDEQRLVGLVAAYDDDDVFMVGGIRGSLDMGAQQHQAVGDIDVLVAELEPLGL